MSNSTSNDASMADYEPYSNHPDTGHKVQPPNHLGKVERTNGPIFAILYPLWKILIEIGKSLVIILAFFRKPFIAVTALLLFITLTSFLGSFFVRGGIHLVHKHLMFSPISTIVCRTPVLRDLSFCSSQHDSTYKRLTSVQEYTFNSLSENVLTHSATVIDLAHLTAQTLPDLIRKLEHSDIPSKSTLVEAFNEVIDFGTPTTRSLQDFGAAVRGSLDTIIGTNKATMNRLQRFSFLSWLPWNSQSQKNTQLLWRAIVRFGQEVDIINDSFTKARDSLQEFQGRLNAAITITSDELHLETQDREIIWNTLWYRLGGSREQVMKLNQDISLLQRALKSGSRGIDYIVQARTVVENAHDGFTHLKRKFDLELDSNDCDTVEFQFMIIAESVQRLSELRVKGFGKAKNTLTIE